jgi:hypothetical protein
LAQPVRQERAAPEDYKVTVIKVEFVNELYQATDQPVLRDSSRAYRLIHDQSP